MLVRDRVCFHSPVLPVAEVTDPGPEERDGGGLAGRGVAPMSGCVLQYGAARPAHPLHTVDGQLEDSPGPRRPSAALAATTELTKTEAVS